MANLWQWQIRVRDTQATQGSIAVAKSVRKVKTENCAQHFAFVLDNRIAKVQAGPLGLN